MKIVSSDLQLASSHSSLLHHEIREALYVNANNGRQPANTPLGAAASPPADKVSLSDAGMAAQAASITGSHAATAAERAFGGNDPKLMLIRAMLEMWLGHSVRIFSAADLPQQGQQPAAGGAPVQAATGANANASVQPAISGFYTRREIYMESEQTQFSANGTVKTADGREIYFQLQLSMSRSYYEESSMSLFFGEEARRVDPLVINFAGTAAQLTDQRFAFDLFANSDMKQINFVAPGSGFLVFDRNQDGAINDGSELFGPTSGDGFAELAALDDDGNGWIDENDAAFGQLQIWIRDADGADRLLSLAEAGIGAISLSRIATPFDIKTSANDLLGQIRSSGVFLHENGMAGTIQQIDLTV
ncbi:MAG: VCBS repeat-containing protein [Betaproteobacteria bacterium]|nr:VCBS repeat-containing protein [Betaproteobacteria bacterium]